MFGTEIVYSLGRVRWFCFIKASSEEFCMLTLGGLDSFSSQRIQALLGLKPAVLSIGLILLIQLVLGSCTQANPWMLLPIIMLFYGILAIAIFITRSFDPEDMAVRVALKRRLRLTASRVHRIISRFK